MGTHPYQHLYLCLEVRLLSPVDLEIVVYIQYIINNPSSKDPLLVWPSLVRRGLRIYCQLLPIMYVHPLLRDFILRLNIG